MTVAVAAFVTMLTAACAAPKFKGVAFEPPEAVPPVTLHQTNGTPFDFSAQHGDVVVLFFGYTHCPDICPTTLSDWRTVKRTLGGVAGRVRFVFVSVDPARDTPALTQHYAASFDPSFLGLSGDSSSIATVQRAFHITSSRESATSSAEYAVIHPGQTFVIDPRGRLRLLYEPGTPSTYLADDIKKLLRGG